LSNYENVKIALTRTAALTAFCVAVAWSLSFSFLQPDFAHAQDSNQPPTVAPQTPLDQALSERLIAEVYTAVQLRQQNIALQTALAQAQAQIEDLKKQLAKKETPK
jgi:hypothetical protein